MNRHTNLNRILYTNMNRHTDTRDTSMNRHKYMTQKQSIPIWKVTQTRHKQSIQIWTDTHTHTELKNRFELTYSINKNTQILIKRSQHTQSWTDTNKNEQARAELCQSQLRPQRIHLYWGGLVGFDWAGLNVATDTLKHKQTNKKNEQTKTNMKNIYTNMNSHTQTFMDKNRNQNVQTWTKAYKHEQKHTNIRKTYKNEQPYTNINPRDTHR